MIIYNLATSSEPTIVDLVEVRTLEFHETNFSSVFRQFVRNGANAVLGGFRAGGPRELRAGRHQSVHQVLGHADVRHILGDQHRRPIESANRHDEPFLSVDLRELTSACL